jgi:hypothetical protein
LFNFSEDFLGFFRLVRYVGSGNLLFFLLTKVNTRRRRGRKGRRGEGEGEGEGREGEGEGECETENVNENVKVTGYTCED